MSNVTPLRPDASASSAETTDWSVLDPRHDTPPADRERLETLVLQALAWPKVPPANVFAKLNREHFHRGANGVLFAVMQAIEGDRGELTPAALIAHLNRDGDLANVGGVTRVMEVCVPPGAYPGDPGHLAEALMDHARRDRLARIRERLDQRIDEGDIDPDAFAEALRPHAHADHEHGVDRMEDVIDEVYDRLEGNVDEGLRLGLGPFDFIYRVVLGLLTVVTGIPGSGKSSFIDQLTLRLAQRFDWRFAVFTPESAPTARHAAKLVTMHSRGMEQAREEAIGFVADHFTWVNSTNDVTVDEVLRRALVIHRKRPIQGLVIDPWNELDHTRSKDVSETQHISACLTKIRRTARRYNWHVWIIAHPTKLQKNTSGNYPTPSLYDVSGSSTWRDKADMGLVVERDLTQGHGQTTVYVSKVRFDPDHGRLDVARFDFDPRTRTYSPAVTQGRGGVA